MRKPAPGRSLADLRPDVAGEWHPSRNGQVTSADISVGSGFKAWWRCGACRHVWPATVASRTNRHTGGAGCPQCGRKRISKARRRVAYTASLAALKPELAAELVPKLNNGITADCIASSSANKYRFRCACGNLYTSAPNHRAGPGCASCIGRRPKPGRNLAQVAPEVAAELDPDLNGGITAEQIAAASFDTYWWRCPIGHTYEMQVFRRTDSDPRRVARCPSCYMGGTSVAEQELRSELAAAGVPVSDTASVAGVRPDIVIESWRIIVEYDGAYYHRDRSAQDCRQTRKLNGAGYRVVRVREAPLKPLGPHDVTVPDPSTPVERAKAVLAKLADLGHSSRTMRSYLSTATRPWAGPALRAVPWHRSLAAMRPVVAALWDAEANAPLTPADVSAFAEREVDWHCPNCDHRFRQRVCFVKGCGRCRYLDRRCGITDADVAAIRAEYAAGGVSQAELGKRYGVSGTTIFHIIHHKRRFI